MRVLFAGNRRFVLEELLKKEAEVTIACITGTHLEHDQILNGLDTHFISSSRDIHDLIRKEDFDLFISNGLPYRLKISELPDNNYINIHPSYLPDLRGVDPVLGSILFKRDAGATCHHMNNALDDGDIIHQVRIPYTSELTASLLYQLSFMAEKECFVKSWEKGFLTESSQTLSPKDIYFTRDADTRFICFNDEDDAIVQTVKAFDNRNQGARFHIKDKEIICYGAEISLNSFLLDRFKDADTNTAILHYEDSLLIKRPSSVLILKSVVGFEQHMIGFVATGRVNSISPSFLKSTQQKNP